MSPTGFRVEEGSENHTASVSLRSFARAAVSGMVRALVSRIAAVTLALLLGSTSLLGCKGNCRQLSEKLCQCAVNSAQRDACLQQASRSDGRYPTEPPDEARCGELLPGCDCHLIDTPAGKEACGLSR